MKTRIKLSKTNGYQIEKWVRGWNEKQERSGRMIVGFEYGERTCTCTLYHDLDDEELIKTFLYWGWSTTGEKTTFKTEF